MAFLTSDNYGKAWQGDLFIGWLKFACLGRLELTEPVGGKVRQDRAPADNALCNFRKNV